MRLRSVLFHQTNGDKDCFVFVEGAKGDPHTPNAPLFVRMKEYPYGDCVGEPTDQGAHKGVKEDIHYLDDTPLGTDLSHK